MPLFILDGFRSAYNVGSAFRSAEAASPCAVLLCGVCATPGNAGAARLAHTARGTQKTVPWRYFRTSAEAVDWAAGTGRRTVVLENAPGAVPLPEAAIGGCDAFVFGNEADGVDPGVAAGAGMIVRIPQSGSRSCINVASAVAIVAYELVRRRIGGAG